MGQFVAAASPQLRSLWAKSGDEDGWLSLPQHLADTACVAAWLWDHWVAGTIKASLSEMLGIEEHHARTLLAFLAGVHDTGKATLKFGRQIEDRGHGRAIVDGIAESGLPLNSPPLESGPIKFPHGLAGDEILFSWLKAIGCKKTVADALSSIVGAHHGIPSTAEDKHHAEQLLKQYPIEWKTVQTEILDGMAAASGVLDVLPLLRRRPNADSAMLLAGLVVMSDWIASNAELFPLVPTSTMTDRATSALEALNLTGPWHPTDSSHEDVDEFFRKSFGWPDHFNARPIQRAAIEAISATDTPCMAIVEAPTGEGKTEAALAMGRKIAERTKAQGLFLATPTMGTSNGLFPRARDWAALNTPGHKVTSMNLVHSRRMFSEDFRAFEASGIAEDETAGHGSVIANQWFRGAKKALLSNFVVATVDQVLMMALQMRHSMLRHIALAGKVIVVDEVHSYDLYMSSYLQVALEWLARYRVSVILLSATLPHDMKLKLVKAYGGQFRDDHPEELASAYPLLTVVDRSGVREIEIESRPPDMTATIEVIPDSAEELADLVRRLTEQGGCILIICNTVGRAQETYRNLEAEHPGHVELHHSAFMASDRSRREDALRIALGPDSHRGSGRPRKRLIVSTQVAEQSLDIDADALITDIAPMDLLIQRIGRIHRHSRPLEDRPEPLRRARVYVRGIEEAAPVPVFEKGTAAVYEPAILASTLANLPASFERPTDISELVQATYSPGFTPPDAWAESYAAWHAEMMQSHQLATKRASTFQIPCPRQASKIGQLFRRYHPSMENSPKGEEAGAAQVRDSDPTFEVIPIMSTDYGYLPMPSQDGRQPDAELVDEAEPDFSTAFRLASSVLRLPARFSRDDRVFERVIEKLELETPAGWSTHYLLKGQVALRFNADGETELDGRRLRYSSELGLEQVRDERQ